MTLMKLFLNCVKVSLKTGKIQTNPFLFISRVMNFNMCAPNNIPHSHVTIIFN